MADASGDKEMDAFQPVPEEDPPVPEPGAQEFEENQPGEEGALAGDGAEGAENEEADGDGGGDFADFMKDNSRFGITQSGAFNYEASRQRRRTIHDIAAPEDVRVRRDTAIPLSFVIERIRHQIESSELTTDLLIFIPFIVLFLVFFLAGSDTEANYYILKGVRDTMFLTEFPKLQSQLDEFRDQILTEQDIFIELDKRFTDIQNFGDWNDFVIDVIIEHTFDCVNVNYSYPLLSPRGQDYHLGGIRFRTLRMLPDSCGVDSQLYPSDPTVFPRTCWAPHDRNKEEKVSPRCNKTHPLTGDPMFEYHKCSGWVLSAMDGVYHCGGYSFQIPFNSTCEQARAVQEYSQDGDCIFVDNWASRVIIAEWFFYTPSTDMWHGVKLYSEIMAGGQWSPQYLFRSFKVWTNKELANLILDSVFFLYVLYYWLIFFIDFVRYIRKEHKCLGFFLEFWNILELANLITFVVIFVFRFLWLAKSQKALSSLKFSVQAEYPDHMDALMYLWNMQIYCNSVNTILTFLKILKYVRLNERLGVLGRTIANCQQSIFGVLVLFAFILLCFGLAGWSLFGINLPQYRGLGVSMSSLMRILTGEIDYEAMRRENRFLAGAFFWLYVILALFLLLNFIIAIITKSFEDISGKAFAQDFDETLVRLAQHLRQYMQCSNIKRILRSCLCPGARSENELLRVVLANLEAARQREAEALAEARRLRNEERRQAREGLPENEGADDDIEDEEEEISVMMMRNDWVTWVDTEVYAELTDLFFDYTWDDIMNQYDDARKSSEEVQKRQMLDTVRTAVEKLVSEDIKKITDLDETLTLIEKEVLRLKEYLKK